jgi:nucleoside phosphorylase
MIVSAGVNESFSFATPIGVGLIDSAINLSRLCMFDKPDFLLFIGSCGCYNRDKYNVFDIVESSSASQIETSFFQNNSYSPIDNAIESKSDFVDNMTMVNSSNYINTNINDCSSFIKNNIYIENMEFFSVLRVAQEHNIPAGGIFVITNYTDKNAHKDFIINHQKAMNILTDYLKQKKFISSTEI